MREKMGRSSPSRDVGLRKGLRRHGRERLTRWSYLLAIPLALGPVAPGAFAQQAPPAQPRRNPRHRPTRRLQLEQILAPIALYPDDLLTQILVASTYPLEVVMANRWIAQPGNKDLKGDALLKALDGQDWDASVKSLVPFPTVLKMMSDQLDWTQKLGDAFLAQQADVFAAVQALRGRAQAAGTLQSNTQQTVTQDASAIVIQPTQANTVYVPAYNPPSSTAHGPIRPIRRLTTRHLLGTTSGRLWRPGSPSAPASRSPARSGAGDDRTGERATSIST